MSAHSALIILPTLLILIKIQLSVQNTEEGLVDILEIHYVKMSKLIAVATQLAEQRLKINNTAKTLLILQDIIVHIHQEVIVQIHSLVAHILFMELPQWRKYNIV